MKMGRDSWYEHRDFSLSAAIQLPLLIQTGLCRGHQGVPHNQTLWGMVHTTEIDCSSVWVFLEVLPAGTGLC